MPRKVPSPLLVVTVLLLLSAARTAAQPIPEPELEDPRILRLHDLGGITRLAPSDYRVMLSMPLATTTYSCGSEMFARNSYGEEVDGNRIKERRLEQLLSCFLGSDAMLQMDIEFRGGRLWVRAHPRIQRRIANLLRALRTCWLASADVTAHVVDPALLRSASGAVLTGTEIDALLNAHPPSRSLRARVRVGRTARLIAARRPTIMHDYDVEVSQGVWGPDPIVSQLLLGLELWVAVHDATDDKLFVTLDGRHARLDGPIRAQATTDNTGLVQLAATHSTVASASAVVPNGGGFLVGHDGPEGSAWLVRVRRRGRVESVTAGRVEMIPAGDLLLPPRPARLPRMTPPNPSGFGAGVGGFDEELDEEDLSPHLDEQLIEEWFIPDTPGVRALQAFGFVQGDRIVFSGTEAVIESTKKALSALSRGLARSVNIELRIGEVKASLDASAAQLASRLPRRVLCAGRDGDAVGVVGGREEAIHKDNDVEIGPDDVRPDPVIDTVLTGFEFSARTQIGADGRLRLAGRIFWQESVSPRARYDSTFPRCGSVDTVDLAHATVQDLWLLERNRWHLLLMSPVEGTDHHVAAVVRVTY